MKEEKAAIKAQIVHNPTAGDGKHKKEDLIHHISSKAGEVHYASINNPFWNKLVKTNVDVIFVAGGDGTIRKLAKVLLNGDLMDQRVPIQVLPLGTANNIARILGIEKGVIENFDVVNKKAKKVDVGRVKGLRDETFFLESAGFGVFPRLILEMDTCEKRGDNPSQELERSLQAFLEVVETYEAKKAEIEVDGVKTEGSFLLVELMNIKYIGPNFEIAPESDPGDGYLNLVLIREEDREGFRNYVEQVVKGNFDTKGLSNFASIQRLKKVAMKWDGKDAHIDDNLISRYAGERLEAKIEPEALVFLT